MCPNPKSFWGELFLKTFFFYTFVCSLVKDFSDVCIYNLRVSLQIRSLLFGAVYSDGGNGKKADLPSLVCASDSEEDGGTEE